MHFRTSLPVLCATLSTLYYTTSALSAASSVIDFRNLRLPHNDAPIPLGDFGGLNFENIAVTQLTTSQNTQDSGVTPVTEGGANPEAETPSTTVAIIDPKTAPGGGKIRIPEGKRLNTLTFLCCSSAAGESILEGHSCVQKDCKASAQVSRVGKNRKRVRATDGVAVTGATLDLAAAKSDFETGTANMVTLTFTGEAAKRERRGNRDTARMSGVDGMIMVITDMEILSIEDDE